MASEKGRVATTGILAAAVATEDQAGDGRPAVPRHVERAATSAAMIAVPIDQPTMRRLNRSSTTARYK